MSATKRFFFYLWGYSNTILTSGYCKAVWSSATEKINENNVVMHPKYYIAEQWVKNK